MGKSASINTLPKKLTGSQDLSQCGSWDSNAGLVHLNEVLLILCVCDYECVISSNWPPRICPGYGSQPAQIKDYNSCMFLPLFRNVRLVPDRQRLRVDDTDALCTDWARCWIVIVKVP